MTFFIVNAVKTSNLTHFHMFVTGSAASLDPFADSPDHMRVAVKRWDSDIEIISNPSQSSIEVLDEHARYNELLSNI
jgi:hypothetical protein